MIGWFSDGGFSRADNPLAHTRGAATVIDGSAAKVHEASARGHCKSMGGTVQITASVRSQTGVLTMVACLSNPSPEVRQQVLISLRSLKTS